MAFEIVKESVERLYGFRWPDGVGFEEGCQQLLRERVAYWNDRVRRSYDEQGPSRATGGGGMGNDDRTSKPEA